VGADDGPGDAPPRVLRLDLEYDGERFLGWQRQAGGRTVQGVVEEALARVLGAPTPVVAAGRTDAGVHALGMVASARTRSTRSAREVARALDALLPEDVGVRRVSDAAPTFHALRDARWKWYRYLVLRSRARRVFRRRTAWLVRAPLDLARVREAAALLCGRRDFAAFQSSGSPRASTVRTLSLSASERGACLRLDAVAEGFLYGMVRAIAGTLVEVGRGALAPSDVSDALASRDRRRAGPAAPPHGLCLVAVGYAGEAPPPFALAGRGTGVESGPVASETRALRILITGRHVGVTEAMKDYAREKASKLEKLNDRLTRLEVTMDVDHDAHRVEIVADAPRGVRVVGKAEGPDMYAAVDIAEERVASQLRKLHQRLTDHHRGEESMGSVPRGAVAPEAAADAGPPEPRETYEDVVDRLGED
jgi:tRNA pseudouridine38-40 synthase